MMPRPVLTRLGLNYRRVPVLAVGRDIYCDSRCIIQSLEERYPSHNAPKLGVDPDTQPFNHAIEKILEIWIMELVFPKTTALIPLDAFLARGPRWIEDRRQLTGWTINKEILEEKLPDALVGARIQLNLVEMLLRDGRPWIAGEQPGLSDIHLGFIFDWILRGEGELSPKNAHPELFQDKKYSTVMDWNARLTSLVAEKKKQAPIERLTESQTVKLIEESEFWEDEELEILDWDPTNLEKGTEIDLMTTDVPSGFQNRDTGRLVGMTADRVTITGETQNKINVRIHYPRTNVKAAKAHSAQG